MATPSYWSADNFTTMVTINSTPAVDVLVYGCINKFDAIACIRSSILTFLALLTAILCILKVIKLHHARHQNWHQYFIFYCASLECVIAAVHWVLSLYVQIDFALQWLKLSQFLVMCHFYWTLATRALRREMWTKRFLLPFLAIASLYFTTVAVLGIVNVQDTVVECFQPYWIMMSSAEFIIVQLFCVAGFYITRRLNEISTLDSVRRSQKRDLWCIVVVFEISALIGVLYDLTLRIVGDREKGCSAIFRHTQQLFSVIYFSFMVAKLLLPIWVMLFVFQPTPQVTVETDDLIPALTDDGNSAFSANTDEQYRQMYHPTESYRTLAYDSPSAHSPASGFTGSSPINHLSNYGVANGGSNNVYKPVQAGQLDTIGEESSVQLKNPNISGSQGTTVRSRPRRGTPTGPRSNTIGAERSNQSSETNSKQKSESVLQQDQHAVNEPNDTNENQSISKGAKPVDDVTKMSGSTTDYHSTQGKQTVPSQPTTTAPLFSVNGTDEDSEYSPVPKGKFYI
ncbi:hypothetical protein ACF0H5_008294 [Mactra antiquata]